MCESTLFHQNCMNLKSYADLIFLSPLPHDNFICVRFNAFTYIDRRLFIVYNFNSRSFYFHQSPAEFFFSPTFFRNEKTYMQVNKRTYKTLSIIILIEILVLTALSKSGLATVNQAYSYPLAVILYVPILIILCLAGHDTARKKWVRILCKFLFWYIITAFVYIFFRLYC